MVRLSIKNTITKFYQLQLKYLDSRKTKVTIFNVLIDQPGEVLTSYLSLYGDVEAGSTLCRSIGVQNRNYSCLIVPLRAWFAVIPATLT